MKRFMGLMVCLLCLLSAHAAGSNDEAFAMANKAYQSGQYEQAIEGYARLVSSGTRSAELYYNIGNAYYKNHQNGLAILCYEKALRLAPEDEDIRHNLRLANTKTADRIVPVQELGIITAWRHFVQSHPARGWAMIGIVLIWIALLCMAVYLFVSTARRVGFYIGLLCVVLSLFATYIGYGRYMVETHPDEAILTVSNTYVKSAPDLTSTDLFIIHEGAKLKLLDQVGEWVKIRLVDGKVGWVQRGGYATI